MNGTRYDAAETAEGRYAAIIMELLFRIERRNRRENRSQMVDYADLEAALRPYVKKERDYVALETIRDVRTATRTQMTELEAQYFQKVADDEMEIQRIRESKIGT